MRKLIAALAALAAVVIPGSAVGAVDCTDPITANEVQIHRSLSGVEVDWWITVKTGCTARPRAVIFKDDAANQADVESAQVYASPKNLELGQGQHVVNNLVTGSDPVWATLYVNGGIYRITLVDPADYPA